MRSAVFTRISVVVGLVCISLLGSGLTARAGDLAYLPKPNQIPKELQDVGIDQHLGSSIDLNLTFQDETGKTVPLKNYFTAGKPVLFFLVYYKCPNLCTFVLSAAVDAMRGMEWTSGDKFQVVAISIDPNETPQMATEKKQAYLQMYGRANGADGWHFLVGKQPEITKISQQIGFKYKWDPAEHQFAHASSMFVLTPEGKISRYFFGILYPSRDVRIALLEASGGRIGSFADKVLLFCFHYDSATGKYSLAASRIMRAGGAITVFILATFLFSAWYKERDHKGVT